MVNDEKKTIRSLEKEFKRLMPYPYIQLCKEVVNGNPIGEFMIVSIPKPQAKLLTKERLATMKELVEEYFGKVDKVVVEKGWYVGMLENGIPYRVVKFIYAKE